MEINATVQKTDLAGLAQLHGFVNSRTVELGSHGVFQPGTIAFKGFVGRSNPADRTQFCGVFKFGEATPGAPTDEFAFLGGPEKSRPSRKKK